MTSFLERDVLSFYLELKHHLPCLEETAAMMP